MVQKMGHFKVPNEAIVFHNVQFDGEGNYITKRNKTDEDEE